MKIGHKMIALSILLGLLAWIIDSVVDFLVFYDRPFWDLLLFDIPPHELYIRSILLAFLVLFGIIAFLGTVKFERTRQTLNLRNRAITSAVNGIIITRNSGEKDHPIIYVNPAFERISGYSSEEVLGLDCRFLQGEDKDQPELEIVRQALRQRLECQVVLRNYHKDGSMFWNELNISPVCDKEGKVTHYVGIISDITKRKKAEEALSNSEQRFRALAETATDAIISANSLGEIIFWNSAAQRIFGYSASEITGRPIIVIMPERYREAHLKALNQVIKTGKPGLEGKIVEFSGLKKDGTEFPMDLSVASWGTEEGFFFTAIIRDITERKQAENKIAMLAKFPSENTNPVLRISADGTVLYGNKASSALLDTWQCEVGKTLPVRWHQYVLDALNSSLLRHTEAQCNGLTFSLTFAPVVDSDYVNIYALDITDLKHAEAELRKSEEKYRLLFDSNPHPMWVYDVKTLKFLAVNDTAINSYGYSRDQFLAMTIKDIRPPEDVPALLDSILNIVPGVDFGGVWRHKKKDGTVFFVETIAHTLMFEDRPAEIVLSIDITERKLAEEKLVREQKLLRTLIDNMPDFIYVKDTEGRFVICNNAIANLRSVTSADQLIGTTDFDFFPKQLAEEYCADEQNILKTGQPLINKDEPNVDRDGNKLWILTTKVPLFEPDGSISGIVGVSRNITDRKHAEEERQKTEEQYRTLVETMNEGVGVVDKNFAFTYVNTKLCEMIGYAKDQMMGRHLIDFIHEDSKDFVKEQIVKRQRGEAERYEIAWKTKDGRKIYVLVSPRGLYDADGNFTGSLGVLTDITESRQAREERDKLMRTLASKNKELESILYVASHDLRSPLVNIQGFSHELSRNCDLIHSIIADKVAVMDIDNQVISALDKGIPEALNFIVTSANKMDLLLSGLLRLSRLGSEAIAIKQLDMNKMAANVAGAMEYQIKDVGATVDIESLPPCLGDPSQINQIFSNLLDNALKFLDDSRPGFIRISGKVENNQSIYCVEDNGIGIAPEYQDKIFETFHRLEPERTTGEGLGLTIVRRVLDRYNGNVWVESEPGKGSKFYVSLPRA